MEFIYALSNQAMPGLLKLGRSTTSVVQRASELSAASGVPLPFVVEHVVEVHDSLYAERDVHGVLFRQRLSQQREFFRCTLADAKEAMAIAQRVDGMRIGLAEEYARWLLRVSSPNEIERVVGWLRVAVPVDVVRALRRVPAEV